VIQLSKINISLDKEFLKRLDQYSSDEGKTRSGFIREAVTDYMIDLDTMKELEEKKKKVQEAKSYFRKLAEKNRGWDGVSEIRKWRDKQ